MHRLSLTCGTPSRRRAAPAARGFTLIELLVVIGIIVVLVTILVPVLSKVRRAAYAHQTREEINRLEDAISRYFDDFKAYPGPFSNDDIVDNQMDWPMDWGIVEVLHPEHGSTWGNGLRGGSATQYPWPTELSTSGSPTAGKPLMWVTSTENLVLGLLGGLVWEGPSNLASYNPALFDTNYVAYDPNSAYLGKGPMNLNPTNPHRFPAYMEARPDELTRRNNNYTYGGYQVPPGEWVDPYFVSGFASGQYAIHNSVIPELLDRFGDDAMPILYLRARVGAPGIACDFATDRTSQGQQSFGNNNTLGMLQYDMGQCWDYLASPYSTAQSAPGPGQYPDPVRLGQSGIPNKFTYYSAVNSPGTSFFVHHGLLYAGVPYTNMTGGQIYDRDPLNPELPGLNFYVPFLLEVSGTAPAWWTGVTSGSGENGGSSANYYGTPKNKDRFILLSAGVDRIFGTMDDIANFQLNQPLN